MQITAIPFSATDWTEVEAVEHAGLTGTATWKCIYINEIRIRLVVYSANYHADHWCSKGHIIFCVKGKMKTHLQDGRVIKISKGMMYTVGDNCEDHQSSSKKGCTLFIVD